MVVKSLFVGFSKNLQVEKSEADRYKNTSSFFYKKSKRCA